MTLTSLREALYKTYGFIKRSRACYLYTQSGRRLVDLYQEGGRAILGYNSGKVLTVLKNTLSRGAQGFYVTASDYSLERAISKLLGGTYSIACFYSKEVAIAYARERGYMTPAMWQAWDTKDYTSYASVIIAPPMPTCAPYYILAIKGGDTNIVKDAGYSGAIKKALARSIYDYIAFKPLRGELQWRLYDKVLSLYFTREGPYLYSKLTPKDYDSFVLHCLGLGLLLSPCLELPSIVPYKANVGDFTLLKNNPFSPS